MRLIDTRNLQFKEFPDSELPRYMILSHRWGREEITFEDMGSLKDASYKKGHAKLKRLCDVARAENCDYIWMDTCCINKSNSTELGEAINSMYRWYSEATACIAYLEDVGSDQKSMEESEWFDRGWTLQELIAPANVSFYNHDWDLIGTKRKSISLLSTVTGIPEDVLSCATKPNTCSIAQRMSWAAKRKTERVEDRAYSLMGLFDVSLPMIYGEREKTFLRLQEEIIGKSDDESIFVWSLDSSNHPNGYSGLLAPSPTSFADCGQVNRVPTSLGFSISNVGLSIQVSTVPYSLGTYLAFLNCRDQTFSSERYAILVIRLPTDHQYSRVTNQQGVSRELLAIPQNTVLREIRVRQYPTEPPLNIFCGFWLRTLKPPGHDDCKLRILSRNKSSQTDHVYSAPGNFGTTGIVSLRPTGKSDVGSSTIRWMKFGFDMEFNPVCLLSKANTEWTPMKRMEKLYREAHVAQSNSAYADLFDATWIGETEDVPKSTHGWPYGDRILRASRETGLSASLHGLSLQISIKLVPNHNPTTNIGEVPPEDPKIWTVDITELEDVSPGWESCFWKC